MFQDIKVGDRVGLYLNYYKKIGIVDKVTPKRFEIGHYRFDKKDGICIGGWNSRAMKLTPEFEQELLDINKRTRLLKVISKYNYMSLTSNTLEQIAELIKKDKKSTKEVDYFDEFEEY